MAHFSAANTLHLRSHLLFDRSVVTNAVPYVRSLPSYLFGVEGGRPKSIMPITDLLNWCHTIESKKYAVVLSSLFVYIISIIPPPPQLHPSTFVSFSSLCDCPRCHFRASVPTCFRITTHTLVLFCSSPSPTSSNHSSLPNLPSPDMIGLVPG